MPEPFSLLVQNYGTNKYRHEENSYHTYTYNVGIVIEYRLE